MRRIDVDYANTPASPARPTYGYRPADPAAPPAVSIVTPYYNTGPLFLETASAVSRQSLQQWEWLIVNDGSDQREALQTLEPFRSGDPRIQVIDLPANQGLPAARNAALRRASAELAFFLDSDDLIEPTALEKMAWYLHAHPELTFCKGWTVAFGGQRYLSTIGFVPVERFLVRNQVTVLAMIRREEALRAGGFDESLSNGLDDWNLWMRCASEGMWGSTIPEPMDWYRRRESHADRWSGFTARGEAEMRREMKRRYPGLYAGRLPRPQAPARAPYADLPEELPFANRLSKTGRRVLLLVPWLAFGGAERFNLDLIGQLKAHGYEVSVAATLSDENAWEAEFARLTPDLFVLPRLLPAWDYPRFLCYLIQSRQIDVVLLTNSEIGYRFLPYLRARCPATAFVDLCHMEEEHWNNGGYPRQAVAYQSALDLNVVTSQHLREWMVGRGADPGQIEVCTTNIDAEAFSPNPALRAEVRQKMGITDDTPVILYAGRLCDQKQPRVFAQVMEELRRRNLRFVCLVAGDGPDRRWLLGTLRRKRLLNQVWMVGAVNTDRMRGLLAAGDIFFLPSRMEGISVAIYEAMAMGVVPVGADVGGQRELVTPECGILIRPGEGEVGAYADALQGLLASAERRDSLGRAARARVLSEFRLTQMGERAAALLELAQQRRHAGDRPLPGEEAPSPATGTRPYTTGTRPYATSDLRLAREHALQAIENDRVMRILAPVWKYQQVEVLRRKLSDRLIPWQWRLDKLLWQLRGVLRPVWRVLRPLQRLRQVKDAIWIAGHRVKVMLRIDSSRHLE